MEIVLLGVAIALLVITVVCQAILLRRPAAAPVDLAPVLARLDALDRSAERSERTVRDESGRSREEAGAQARALREEVQRTLEALRSENREALRGLNESVVKNMAGMGATQAAQLETVRAAVEERLKAIQQDNGLKLDQMRRTVDEQLQGTLERRLGESFKLVSERLEQVREGLGEMRNLATGVGDLKKVLTNVRTRGTWGEVQLGALLDEVLTPEQYQRNCAVTGTAERVEVAILLPGTDPDRQVFLPVDAKFPQEDYLRLVEASERGDVAEIEACSKQLEARVCACARDIRDKYLAPPMTTDFGVMYLPTESLYAEVLRRPGLVESLQRDFRVTVAGPTTLAAFLNSLRMGFRTLAIQRRSSEVWELLAAVKTEFGKYSEVLEKLRKKLQDATNTVDKGLTRTRQIERKLKGVEALPPAEGAALLAEPGLAQFVDAVEAGE